MQVDLLQNFERTLYRTVDNSTICYPNIDVKDFKYMSDRFVTNPQKVMCFPFFVEGARPYIDIYFWDVALSNESYKRFVLQYGFALGKELEKVFVKYLHGEVLVDEALYIYCVRRIIEKYPHIHLQFYLDWRHTLLHLYFTFFYSGPQEILFKAGLNYHACNLANMDGYNMLGSVPDKILGVQLGMLRALNTVDGCAIMEDEENRAFAKHLYAKYHNMIRGTQINKYQWEYIKEQEERGNTVDRNKYKFLGTLSNDNNYYTYLKYIEYKQIVDEYYSRLPQYPDEEDLDGYSSVCDMILWYIEREFLINNRLQHAAQKNKDLYSYETKDYVVLIPTSLRELLDEAQNQRNCLYKYILNMVYDNVVILFMREKGKENKSLITIEIEDGVIKQALKANNHIPSHKEKSFLEEYAASKNLLYLHEFCDIDYFDWNDD